MIDTYFIPPIKHLELGLHGDRLFCLAHFVLENKPGYVDFYKKQKDKFITIDSGVAESSRIPTDMIIKCAEKVGASEIICPDELLNTEKTIELTTSFLNNLTKEEKEKYKFMMVPQAKTIQDFTRCLRYFQSLPECDCIGINKFTAPVLFGDDNDIHPCYESRKRLIDFLVDTNQITKPVHCLGYDNPKEFQHYVRKDYKFIRSCDSASAILCGVKNIKFNKAKGINVIKPAGGDVYHEEVMSAEQQKLALHNIKITREFCE